MQNTFFSMNSVIDKLSTLFTIIKLYTINKNNMKKPKNALSNY